MGTDPRHFMRGIPGRVRILLALALLALGPVPGLLAQGAGSATLRGTVLDPAGSVLPLADVTVTSVRTKAERRAVTNGFGGYVVPALVSGPYRVRVVYVGFVPWESGEVHLSPGDSIQVDATLALVGRTDEITVTAQREMVRQDHGAREGVITSAQIDNLSVVGRNAIDLLRILPGVVPGEGSEAANSVWTSVNGARPTSLSPVLDGSKIGDFGCNCNTMTNINPDMIEEVKVQAGNYAAEYGTSAVQVTAVTKAGASAFHGSLYNYWRNWRLSANDRSNNYAGVPRPESEFLYPGFNLSGPVLVPGTGFNENRDKLFFFVGFEYHRETIDPGTSLAVVPTAAQRTGDFSELLQGEGQNLGQPTTVTIPAGFPGAGQPAPGNDLSPYVDPSGQAYLNLYPQPNHSDPDNRYNYAFNVPLPRTNWQLTSRLDWNVNGTTHAYLRLAFQNGEDRWPGGTWNCCSAFELPSHVVGGNKAWSIAANVTSVLSPTLTNEIVLSASRLELDNEWDDPSRVSRSAVGLGDYQAVFPLETDETPFFVISAGHGLGNLLGLGGMPIFAHNDSVSIADNLTMVREAHTVKLGLFVERGRKQQNYNTELSTFILGGPWTFGATGNDYGDLLVGRMGQFSQGTPTPSGEFRFWNFEAYVQDSWKARRNLTLEAGLRVARLPNNAELTGLALRFEPSAYDPDQGAYIDGDPARPNGILLESRGEIPQGMTEDPGIKLMPRVNFAWDVRGDGDLVLRGGGGLFYNRPYGNSQYDIIAAPPNVHNMLVSWWDVPGGLTIAGLPSIDPWSQLGAARFYSLDPASIHIPLTWNWSLAAAKRIPWSQTVEVAYVGHRAEHLTNRRRANYVPPGALTGQHGNADLDNPLHRAALNSSVVADYRLYPAYHTDSFWWQYEAESTYHGLQMSLSRQAAGRVQYFLNYTFSKVLGTTGLDGALLDPVDPGNRNYGIAPHDRTHIFNAAYNVFLPDPVASDGSGLWRALLNGWQISGVTSYRSGMPYRVVFSGELAQEPMGLAWWATDAHGGGDNQGRAGAITPAFAGDPRLGNTGVGENVLDVDQIAIPALGESGPFVSPYYFRYPSRWNWDLTVFKNFPLSGGKRIQLRVGFFNLFNQAAPVLWGDIDLDLRTECNVRVNGVPDGTGGTANGVCDPAQGFHLTELSQENFGKIVTKRGHRVIELAVRFDF